MLEKISKWISCKDYLPPPYLTVLIRGLYTYENDRFPNVSNNNFYDLINEIAYFEFITTGCILKSKNGRAEDYYLYRDNDIWGLNKEAGVSYIKKSIKDFVVIHWARIPDFDEYSDEI